MRSTIDARQVRCADHSYSTESRFDLNTVEMSVQDLSLDVAVVASPTIAQPLILNWLIGKFIVGNLNRHHDQTDRGIRLGVVAQPVTASCRMLAIENFVSMEPLNLDAFGNGSRRGVVQLHLPSVAQKIAASDRRRSLLGFAPQVSAT
jgi:hypothetical protein